MIIVSPHPVPCLNPITARSAAVRRRICDVDQYAPLPLTLDELEGTTWINVLSYEIFTVGTPAEFVGNYGRIGTFHDERFVVQNWTRWDVLDDALRVRWMEEHVQHLRRVYAATQTVLRGMDDHPKKTKQFREERNKILGTLKEIQDDAEVIKQRIESIRRGMQDGQE
jgi:hypothetical protein